MLVDIRSNKSEVVVLGGDEVDSFALALPNHSLGLVAEVLVDLGLVEGAIDDRNRAQVLYTAYY